MSGIHVEQRLTAYVHLEGQNPDRLVVSVRLLLFLPLMKTL
jgi:hypothetical protein